MPDTLCRLTVQRGDGDDLSAVDVTLPGAMQVGQLLPSIVDILEGTGGAPVTGRRWRLSRLGGGALDESMSLTANGIADGDILLLTAKEAPPPVWVDVDTSHTVARLVDAGRPSVVVVLVAWLLFGAGAAAALVWSPASVTARLSTAAGLAVTAAVGAVVLHRIRDRSTATTLGVVAVLLAAAAGAVAVPSGPTTAHVLLASAAAATTATLLLRLIGGGSACLTAVATATASIAAVTAVAVVWPFPLPTAGALLATLGLAMLSAAPRIAIAVTHIGPPPPTEDPPAAGDSGADARRAHRTLTGLTAGAALAAATGAATAAFGDRTPVAVVFAAIVGLVLVARARVHADGHRRRDLQLCGLACLAAALIAAALVAPDRAPVLCLFVAVACGATLLPGATSPALRRAVDVAEYLALAAVVPLACWLGGVFDFVRGLALS